MNLIETLRALVRRWYITLPGIILAGVLAVFAFVTVAPGYERSASQLLLPDNSSVPEGSNPYLFISGLSQAADVLVRAVGSENVLNEMKDRFPGAEIEVGRDVTTASPVVVITATARTDEEAGEILDQMIGRTTETLDALQADEGIAPDNRITVIPLTVDSEGVVVQRTRLMVSAVVGVAGVVLAIVVAALVEGLSPARRRRREQSGDDEEVGLLRQTSFVERERDESSGEGDASGEGETPGQLDDSLATAGREGPLGR